MRTLILGISLVGAGLWGDIYATFDVQAYREAQLGMNASGIVQSIGAREGDRVKKGALLVSLEHSEEELSLKMAKADLDALEKECSFLSDQYARYEKSAQVFDKNTLQKLKTELDAKLSGRERARLAVSLYAQKLSKMSLYAPFAGSIAQKNIEVGDFVTTMGGSPLFKLVSDQSRLLIRFDSKYAHNVKSGDMFCFNIDGRSTGKCTRITKIYPTVDPKTRQMTAEADGMGLRSGTFGDGQIRGH
ncbi:MAG: transporter [Sulfuricurvum sp. PD_MW2]|jgi:RND family efflux transporter MFP subunit|uniref:efflux RND transporter periplasmic adaptor subunit n=1 Tax=Sulfuricurvum sp. PD_MW2 TaxID=2027917 RepID=UPI000C06569F|nr:efflux RND transporter periplasmic adaptor subunit [Sulfuricurvum sp. PD_MW2]PHM16663.1 MAG: transporter [Sulfuricurvum sp. PD_MW2]